MFLSHTKCLTIIRIKKGTEVIRLLRKFGIRASPFGNLHFDHASRFHFQHQVLDVLLRWPKFPKLKFTDILLPTSYRRSVGEGLLRGSPVGQHGRYWEEYPVEATKFCRMKMLKKLCCPIDCFASHSRFGIEGGTCANHYHTA